MSPRPEPRPVRLFFRGKQSSEASEELFRSSEPIGALLGSVGFWKACRDGIPTNDAWVFKGPWEEGWLEGDELPRFSAECRAWADKYTEAGPIKGRWLVGGKTNPPVWVQAPRSELRSCLLTMAGLADKAHRDGELLFIVT
jgi:hypothetical protein